MQTLGLSDSTPRSEGRLKALLWPAIHNDGDFDYITEQGFWVCFIVAVVSLGLNIAAGSILGACLDFLFYFLAAVGVRQRSKGAGISAFVVYLLSTLVLQRYTGQGFGIGRFIFLALLLSNVRGNWIASKWQKTSEPPVRLSQTIFDKLSDQLPPFLWPHVKLVFWVVAVLELIILVIALFAPTPTLPPQV